ncbi:MAG: winged helix-turn-helix transcriptional regulator [Candidatus Marsarchaeota archaeon]|nr:winged helix-turn-helix transcriptional regulator [Candidatus Marsarchaeota archaeon]
MELPPAVASVLESLRKKSEYSVQVVFLRGSYYVYEYKVKTIAGRVRRFSLYLGKIEKDGTFIAARRRFLHTRVRNLSEYMKMKAEGEKPAMLDALLYPDELSTRIITELSMNSRIAVGELARMLGIKRERVLYRVNQLRKLYKMKYTIEMKPDTFGFQRYLLLAKFPRGKPDPERLRELLGKNPRVQLAATAEGDYNLMIYVLAESNTALEDTIYEMRSSSVFANAPGTWNVSYLIEPYGWYMPFRDEFFTLLKERIWRRSKDSPRRQPGQLLHSEYAVMKELNKDAATNFADIDREYGLKEGNARYTYEKLLGKQTIKRATITMEGLPLKYLEFIYLVQRNIPAFNSTRIEFLENITDETQYSTNKYAYVANSSSPYGIILVTPIFEEKETATLMQGLSEVKGIKIKTASITRVLVGEFGLRKFKMEESNSFKVKIELLKKKETLH